jgi:hypothetical protein
MQRDGLSDYGHNDPRDTPLIERTLVHLVDQAHALDHISTGTAQIHGLSAGADAIGQFDDRHPITTLVEPGGQCRPCDNR